MKKTFCCILLGILILFSIFFTYSFAEYFYRQNQNKSMIEYCSSDDTDECYIRMLELILPKMLLYKAWIEGKEIELIKTSYNPRIDSVFAIEKADKLLGYGVFLDIDYEKEVTALFNKEAVTFDCGVPSFETNNKDCTFYPECIATDKFILEMQTSTGKVHTLEQKLKELNLWDKKVFIKMDVAEGDAAVLPEIIKNVDKITGFNLAMHIRTPYQIIERKPLLDEINKNFILVSRNTLSTNDRPEKYYDSKYYQGKISDGVIYFSYINKNLVDKYEISNTQNTDKYYTKKKVTNLFDIEDVPFQDISWVVTYTEKIKSLFHKK